MVGLCEEWRSGGMVARRIAEADLEDLVRLHQDPLVMAHLGGVRDEQTTFSYLRTNVDHWNEHGFGLFVLRRDDGEFVGRAGLRIARPLGLPEVEVAYALSSRFWGRGYAVEVTERLCLLAEESRICSEVVAFTETSNRQSWRVMQKAGFSFDRQFDYQGTPHVLYRRQLRTLPPSSRE